FFFSSRRRHTRFSRDWSSDVCSSDLHFSARSDRNATLGEGIAYLTRHVDSARRIAVQAYRAGLRFKDAAIQRDNLTRKRQTKARSEERRVGEVQTGLREHDYERSVG